VTNPAPPVASAPPDREFAERVAAIYRQAVPSGWGSVAVALCVVLVMWRFTPARALIGWFALTLCAISFRIPLILGYRADPDRAARATLWARRYGWMIAAIGVCWALAAFVLLDGKDPFAVAAFLMIVALVSGGVIASQSYLFSVARLFLSLALLPLAARLILFGDARYVPMAITVVLFYLFLLAYGRMQSRQLGEAIRLKHENVDLVAALKVEKVQADAMRERAEEANLAKSRFLAAASHDLRQPMHALGLFSASLQEMAMEPDKRVVVEKIFASIDALESLFAELLDLSRLDAGFMQPRMRHVRLAEVFERIGARYSPMAATKDVAFLAEAHGAIVVTDPALLERVLGNLVANAIQYTERGEVLLLAKSDGEKVIVEVTDTGIGIAEPYRERIFEEFFQIGNPERDRRKGLGLGLAIVQRVAVLLDAPLSLLSEEDAGSSFSLTLATGDPARVQADEGPSVMPSPQDILQGKTVLVIDDEASVLEGMGELLGRWGCHTLLAACCNDALEAIGDTRLDVVVADLRLRGGESGLEAIDRVRHAAGRAVPALIITGDTTSESLREAALRGHPVLHKPVRPVRLRAVLSQLAR